MYGLYKLHMQYESHSWDLYTRKFNKKVNTIYALHTMYVGSKSCTQKWAVHPGTENLLTLISSIVDRSSVEQLLLFWILPLLFFKKNFFWNFVLLFLFFSAFKMSWTNIPMSGAAFMIPINTVIIRRIFFWKMHLQLILCQFITCFFCDCPNSSRLNSCKFVKFDNIINAINS